MTIQTNKHLKIIENY